MATYHAPLDDLRYLIHEFLDTSELQQMPQFAEVTPDIIDAILEEAAKLSEEVLFPLNRSGDEESCHYQNGQVTTPAGFKAAYDQFVESGWGNLTCDPEHGGQGLPHVLANLVDETVISANLSFSIYVGLTLGAYHALNQFAPPELKARFLPHMVSGRWSGTMCLTEPHCGTDLGLMRTRAEPQADGSYRLTGSKIFISAGEHDLTENIVHLVLARTPDAPQGVRGISLFLVPKFRANEDGSLGEANGVSCSGIEHKMGIKASATCSIEFEQAEGFLVGELHKGMRAMFVMMNRARLHVGVQGLAMASVAYQGAVAYARERLQGRSLTGAKSPQQAADPIVVHPDVRRMLLTMRAYTEGARALAAWTSYQMDLAHFHPDPAKKQAAEDFIAVMTPVIKAFLTDIGELVTSLGIQVYGGHGYIRENGMEQYLRDARICQLYEGTNGIQAMDLVGRKLPMNLGRNLRPFFHAVDRYLDTHRTERALQPYLKPMTKAFQSLQQASLWIAEHGMSNPDDAGAAASDYLRLFGLVALGFMWLQMAEQALAKEEDPNGFYRAKRDTARFYMERILPQAGALLASIASGSDNLMAFDEAAF